MPISAGILTERVTVQRRTYTQNAIGEQELSYEDMEPAVYPARVKFVKSGNAAVMGQVLDTESIMVTLRYSKALLNVARIIWQGNKYEVDGVPNGDRIERTITITCNLVTE